MISGFFHPASLRVGVFHGSWLRRPDVASLSANAVAAATVRARAAPNTSAGSARLPCDFPAESSPAKTLSTANFFAMLHFMTSVVRIRGFFLGNAAAARAAAALIAASSIAASRC